eukprot:775562-Prymnesium_polylepis.1
MCGEPAWGGWLCGAEGRARLRQRGGVKRRCEEAATAARRRRRAGAAAAQGGRRATGGGDVPAAAGHTTTPVVLSVAECLPHTQAAGRHICAPPLTRYDAHAHVLTHRPGDMC